MNVRIRAKRRPRRGSAGAFLRRDQAAVGWCCFPSRRREVWHPRLAPYDLIQRREVFCKWEPSKQSHALSRLLSKRLCAPRDAGSLPRSVLPKPDLHQFELLLGARTPGAFRAMHRDPPADRLVPVNDDFGSSLSGRMLLRRLGLAVVGAGLPQGP
jgi:hypothetical protein